MKKILDLFLKLEDKLECKAYLAGSAALSLLGAYGATGPVDQIKDLDMVLSTPTDEDVKFLDMLQSLCPNSKFGSPGVGWEVKWQFSMDGIAVDIFVNEPGVFSVGSYLQYVHAGKPIMLNTLPNIIAAKKRLNRSKDWKQLNAISKWISDGLNWDNFVNLKRREVDSVKVD
jgi:hypothetical protein